MARRDYYLILGIPRSESARGIRAAYRDLVKRYHPDRAGEGGREAFQQIHEAYEVLSDPLRRRAYNHQLELSEERAARKVRSLGGRARVPGPVRFEHLPLVTEVETVTPSLEALLDRFVRNFTGLAVPKSEHLEPLDFEVILTSDEAARGGAIPVDVPTFRTCRACGGSGRVWLYPCLDCGQEGIVAGEETVRISIPPKVRSGTIYEVPLHGLGIHNFYLRLHVLVER